MQKLKEIIKRRFRDREGNSFAATDGQAEIFASIVSEIEERVAVLATTQYGKSEITALACIYLCASTKKKILIIAPRAEQAKIIMDYVIQHIFDNPLFEKLIEIEGSIDRFKRERSKTRIDWKTEASIKILTADVRTVSNESKNLMGFGADLVIVDESSLIPDEMFSKIFRMVGGVKNGKIVQLGNPFEKNHFYKAFYDKNYKKIIIDYRQAIEEGRLNKSFLEEARENMDDISFKIFYECKFPDSSTNSLIAYSDIAASINRDVPLGDKIFGCDIARFGDDSTVIVYRNGFKVEKIESYNKENTMNVAGRIINAINEYSPKKIIIDETGVGAGVVDRLKEEDFVVSGINMGEKAMENSRFANLRAEIYWELKEAFEEEKVSIPDNKDLINQLSDIRYFFNSSGKIQIESKEQMKRRGMKSPDIADALAMSFYKNEVDSIYGSIVIENDLFEPTPLY